MLSFTKYLDSPGRALMAFIFLVSGIGKLGSVIATQGYMEAFGVPGILIWPAAAWEILAGAFLLIGLWTRPLSLLLAGWCLLTAFIFHMKWADPMQLINFPKNMTMAGGFLLVARSGAPGFSVDGVLTLRKSKDPYQAGTVSPRA
ncbi:MAG: putative transrane DoxX family protein [Gammaproteobacteria bacterium]|nr:putative transrane DoxX family protein [Gammaproteobacteria bacterium]